MLRVMIAASLLLASVTAASAGVIYQYTGNLLDASGQWSDAFGFGPTPPTQITATVQLASPFPDQPFFGSTCGSVGSLAPGLSAGIILATISDGARTFTSDPNSPFQHTEEVFIAGCGTQITQWYMVRRTPASGEACFRAQCWGIVAG